MIKIESFIILSLTILAADAVKIRVINNCPFTVWPGFCGKSPSNPGFKLPFNGGWAMTSKQTVSIDLPSDYMAARIWGRTNCATTNGKFSCETGDCGPSVQCGGKWGETHVTLAEFAFNQWGGNDFYDISLVDGYNLPMTMAPRNPKGTDKNCGAAACTTPLQSFKCPKELQVIKNGKLVECLTACTKFKTPQYCCTGAFGSEQSCLSTNYAKIFKDACPDAYSYAFDDAKSTFACRNTDYDITFC